LLLPLFICRCCEVATDQSEISAQFSARSRKELRDAYSSLAANKKLSTKSAGENLRTAREMNQRSRDLIQDLRRRGILDHDEATEIEKVGRKIAECEAALKARP